MGTPVQEPEERHVAMAIATRTWSVRLFALFGGLAGLAVGASMFIGEMMSGPREIVAEAAGKCLGAIVLGAIAGAFMAIGRNVANR
jgi:hypothetical protein